MYLFHSAQHGVFSPDGKVDVAPSDVKQINKQIEAQELAHWRGVPDRWQGYAYHEQADRAWQERSSKGTPARTIEAHAAMYRAFPSVVIKTWLGTTLALGHVTNAWAEHRPWPQHPRLMINVRVTGNNGAAYTGRYGANGGSFIRLRRSTRKVR